MACLITLEDLRRNNHELGLYCSICDRWGVAELDRLIATGHGNRVLVNTRFRCRDCSGVVEKQVRPPVPRFSGTLPYIFPQSKFLLSQQIDEKN